MTGARASKEDGRLTLIREEGVEIHLLALFLLAIPRRVVVRAWVQGRGREKSSN